MSPTLLAMQDRSAKAGSHYKHVEGVIEFAPGVQSVDIGIEVLDDDDWSITLSFEVHLLKNSGLKNACVGPHLYRTRVLIINNDMFPTNKYRQRCEQGVASSWSLFKE